MRPYVICHMVTTIDGRIMVDRWGGSPTRPDGASLFETTAATFGVGAWVVGTTTMKEFAAPPTTKLKPAKGPVPPGDHVADPAARALAIGPDAKGVLRKLMLEGGGTFNGAMLAAGLVDEVSQVVVPVVDGGVGVPGMFDVPGGPGTRAAASLRLTSYKPLPGGVTWVRYRVAAAATAGGRGR